MPLVKKTVSYGSFGRDYNSFASFAANLDNTTYPNPGTVVVGELYNDAVFDEHSITISGLGTNIIGLVITAADGEWHEGDPNAGVCFKPTTSHFTILTMSTPVGFRVEKIRFDSNNNNNGTATGVIAHGSGVDSNNPRLNHWDRVIVTGGNGYNAARALRGLYSANRPAMVSNSLFYSFLCNGASTASAPFIIGGDDKIRVFNCTLDHIEFTNAPGSVLGLGFNTDGLSTLVENTIITRVLGASGACLDTSIAHNVATDDATGDIPSITIGDEFTDYTTGDYTLKAGGAAAGAGAELDGMVNMIRKDITGQERAAGAWDIGAYNNQAGYIAAGGGAVGFPLSRVLN